MPVVVPSKTVTPTSVLAGQLVTYTVVAYNRGDAPALGTMITETLPSGFTYAREVQVSELGVTRSVTVTPIAGAVEPGWGVWDIGSKGVVTITFQATTTLISGVYSNTVTAVPPTRCRPQPPTWRR